MSGSTGQAGRRTLTPAVLASALFMVACAAVAVTFVAARGGLELPIAPGSSQAARASAAPTAAPSLAPASPTPSEAPAATPVPTEPATGPTEAPSLPPATAAPSPGETPDPLTALPACPGIDGCFQYEIQRGDSLSGVASRYVLPVWIVLALNPEVRDPGTIVVGHPLYLGRSPFLRLAPCPDRPDCSLYEVQAGDRLSTIAGRYGLTTDVLLEANPEIADANAIRTGQLIRLPHPTE